MFPDPQVTSPFHIPHSSEAVPLGIHSAEDEKEEEVEEQRSFGMDRSRSSGGEGSQLGARPSETH